MQISYECIKTVRTKETVSFFAPVDKNKNQPGSKIDPSGLSP